MKKIILIIVSIIIAFILILGLVNYFKIGIKPASSTAYDIVSEKAIDTEDYVAFDNNENSGIIVYPGGLVDYISYAYISEADANVYLLEAPFGFAFFNSQGATQVINDNSEIENWYVLGHSLGGVVAFDYALQNSENIDGVILLASYPNGDYSNQNTPNTLALFGTKDTSVDDLNSKIALLPENAIVKIIDNANHYNFSDLEETYEPEYLNKSEQMNQVIEYINQFIK